MAPSVAVDTSIENIQRVRSVILPYKVAEDLREKLRLRLPLIISPKQDPPLIQATEPLDRYILLLCCFRVIVLAKTSV